MKPLKVVIADDEAVIRMDLKEILEGAGHEVVGETANGRRAVAIVRETSPDLVIMDIKMPDMDGVEAARLIAADHLAPVLLLTAFDDAEAVKKGVGMTLKACGEILSKMGVSEIEAQGKEFDPNLHNAVMHVEDDSVGENTVVEVLQKGYMKGDKVIRYAMVKVAN